MCIYIYIQYVIYIYTHIRVCLKLGMPKCNASNTFFNLEAWGIPILRHPHLENLFASSIWSFLRPRRSLRSEVEVEAYFVQPGAHMYKFPISTCGNTRVLPQEGD